MQHLHGLIASLATFTIAVISAGGYWGIALLMAIESACIPLPSEIIMPFAGYLVSTGKLDLFLAATAGAIGCNLGSIVAYEVGKRGGRPFVQRWGKYVLVGTHDLDRAEGFFQRWGGITVLVCRLLPVIRTFIAFPAGVARMPLLRFHAYTFIGSWPWCFALTWVGRELGVRWNTDPRLKAVLHNMDVVIVAIVGLAAIWFVWHKVRAIKRER
jgi:membrane protein DedA with SNARE-associated domain